MKKVAVFLGTILTALSIAYGADFDDLRQILTAGHIAKGKTALLDLKMRIIYESDKKVLFTHDRPACNIWIRYTAEQSEIVRNLRPYQTYAVEFKIIDVSPVVINGDLIAIR